MPVMDGKLTLTILFNSVLALILGVLPSAIFGITAGLKFIILLGLTLAVVGRPVLTLLFYLVCALLSSGVFYIKSIYHTYFNLEVGIAFLTSSLYEKWSFISQVNWEWKAFYVFYFALIFYAMVKLWKNRYIKISYSLQIMLLIGSTLCAGLFWHQLSSPKTFTAYFHGVQPLSWMLTLKQLTPIWQEHKKFATDIDEEIMHVMQRTVTDKAETYMFIIGESARRDRFALYGYKHNTNPLLQTLPLIAYTNVVSTHPQTPYSVLFMLTKQPLQEEKAKKVSSFMHVFRQAGFKTYWVSNQAMMGGADSPFSVYAFKSDEKIFLSPGLDGGAVHDELLLPEVRKILKEPANKKLIIVHLYGSHYYFEDRYPAAFNKSSDLYDNSILYNDYVVSEIIKMVELQNHLAGIIYTADHGLHFKECGDTPYHYDSAYNYQVPFLVWLSSQWQQDHPHKTEAVFANVNKKLSTTNVFDSMMGMANIAYQDYQAQQDIFSADFSEKNRWVKNYSGWVDYDKAMLAGPCAVSTDHLKNIAKY